MAAASSDWKHPLDDPPPEGMWILIRTNTGYVSTGKRVKGQSWRLTCKTGAIFFKSITHWAEIYQPPKNKLNADNTTKQATTQQISKDICKGSQTSQATQTITTTTTPTVETRD